MRLKNIDDWLIDYILALNKLHWTLIASIISNNDVTILCPCYQVI